MEQTRRVVVATHNQGKLVEMRRILQALLGREQTGIELVSAGDLNLPDPVETGTTFESNALLKANQTAELSGLPALADDSGLIVDVMGAAPASSRPVGVVAMVTTRPTSTFCSTSCPTYPIRIGRHGSSAPRPWLFLMDRSTRGGVATP